MAFNFCPKCGSSLTSDPLLCSACGSDAADWLSDLSGQRDADVKKSAGAAVDANAESEADASSDAADDAAQTPEEPLQVMRPPLEQLTGAVAYKPMRRDTSYLRQTDSWSMDRRLLTYLGGGALAVMAVLALLIGSCSTKFVDPQAERVVAGGYVEGDSAGGQDAQNEQEQDGLSAEQEALTHTNLKLVYDKIDPLDKQITVIEEDFEADWLQPRVERNVFAQEANDARDAAQALLDEVKALNVSRDSAWYEQYQLLITTCENLVKRGDIIVELWETDLEYNYPQEYTETVFAARTNNTDSTGEVIPVRDFREAYAQINL